ncbi:MAG: Gfo/Idh/MocA family oxidoreductase [Treponema sp.]|nr:Gfo/Idh/MocA family oxidoreductase [Treponema sp.]
MQRIGIVGIGNISKLYLDNLTGMFKEKVKVTCVTDTSFELAQKAAENYNVKAYKSLAEMLDGSDTDIILNITQPKNHYNIALAVLKSGRHVYNEKPICLKREEAQVLIKTAAKKSLRVGCAPDTFLGAALQTCRKFIDNGNIGEPVAATAFIMDRGPEHWHPSPYFFYQDGAGPMFDMGPYYLTALVSLLGPVERICGSARISMPERTITSQQLYGEKMKVEVPTHIAGILDFANGTVGNIITSFDVYSHTLPCLEIYGTEGTLKIPDPNYFGGEVLFKKQREENWSQIPLINNYTENVRGFGIVDMAQAIEENRAHRVSAQLAYHVLDIMHGIHDASKSGKYYKLKSSCPRPEAL